MATSQPQGHLLIVSDCMRRSREFNLGPIMEEATLLQLGQAMVADKAMVAVCLP